MKIANGRTHFYQWDLNQQLELSFPCAVVYFENGTQSESLGCEVKEVNGKLLCDVPNDLLQTAAQLHAYAWDAEKTYVIAHMVFAVEQRERPADYVYTQTEVWTAEKAVAKALQAAKESGDFNGYSPYTYLSNPVPSEPTVLYGLPSGLYVFDGYFKKNANSAVERITPDVLWTVNSINAETWMCGISCAASVFAYRIRIDTVRLFNFDLFNSITMSNIHERVISSLTGKVSAMTTADQKAACKWLGTLNVIENPDGSLTVVFPSGKTKHIDLSKIEIFL